MNTPHDGIRFVPLGPADVREVSAVDGAGPGDHWTERALGDELAVAHGFHFGARALAGGTLCAFILCRLQLDELHIHRLCTHPAHRRTGLAAALLGHAGVAAKVRGAAQGFLEVKASNGAAVRLYARAGFTVDYERKAYYTDDGDALVMHRPL
jgi:[ribosomal protein S18]-alanine N-acetyltransferase